MTAAVFSSLYSECYDLMYADKSYDKEAEFVVTALKRGGIESGSVLSIGAGTLNYETRIAAQGYSIHGIDQSQAMLDLGREKLAALGISGISLEKGDMLALPKYERAFDAALIMFNVLGYCRNEEEAGRVFAGVARNIRPGGVFMFDCWNRQAVLADPPQSRWKKFSGGGRELYRLTEARPSGDGAVDLRIELIQIAADGSVRRGLETHEVRSWSPDSLIEIAARHGFEHRHSRAFPEWDEPVSRNRWPAALIFRKRM